MFKSSIMVVLFAAGLSGCLATQNKTGLARPDFSQPAPVASNVAPVKTSSCCCGKKEPAKDVPAPEPKKIIGEFPEYQDEDTGEGPI